MEAIDKKTIEELKSLMGKNINSVFSAFVQSSDFNLVELEKAIKDSNLSKIEQSSHAMKGSSANIGAKRLSKICEDVVKMARNKEEQGYNTLFGGLKDEYEKVLSEIELISCD